MRLEQLCALLQELPAADRALLECRIVDGWQYKDIAFHLGVRRDVLVRRVHRLRTDLRRKAKAVRAVDSGAAVDVEDTAHDFSMACP